MILTQVTNLWGTTPQQIFTNISDYILTIILTVLGFYILSKVLVILNHYAAKGYLARKSKARRITVISLIDNFIKYAVAIVGLFATLIALGFDKTTILASAGATSIVVGVAGKELITDFINGFFTVVEGYYEIGDYIVVNGHTGVVESLGIKATTMRTDNGEQIIIPNSLIEEIVNYNSGDHHLYLTIRTSYEQQYQLAREIIDNKLIPEILADDKVLFAKNLGVSALSDSSVDHRLKVSCDPNNRFQVERDVYTKTKIVFEENNIEIPYGKLVVLNQDK